MNRGGLAAAALVILGLAAGTGAVGTILTTDADIGVGAATTPGTITIDPAYPIVAPPTVLSPDPLGSIGSITGAIPAFPGSGTGADGVFASGTGATLAAGTYDYSSFTVAPGALVLCDGPVVLRVTGNTIIGGTLYSTVDGASIVMRCGGDLTVAGGDVNTTNFGIETSGASSPIDVHAMGDVRLGDQLDGNAISYVTAFSGAVTVTGGGAAKVFEAGNTVIESSNGTVMVRAAGSMELTGFRSRVQSSVGSIASQMLVQAFGGALSIDAAKVKANNFTGDLLVEASAGITVVNGAEIRGSGNPNVKVSAFGGDLVVSQGTLAANTGGVLFANASAGVVFTDGSSIGTENGPLVAVAHGGDLTVQLPGAGSTTNVGTYHGNMLVAASGDVVLGSYSNLTSFDGRTDVDAFGDVLVTGTGSMIVGSYMGDLEVVAAAAIVADVDATEGPNCRWRGGVVRIHAGPGGADLDDMEVDSESGDLDVIATGPIASHEALNAAGHLSVESAAGDIDINGGTLVTNSNGSPPALKQKPPGLVVQSAPPPPQDSGSILVWCHQQNGTIDASGASLHSGDAAGVSGDVSLLVNGASAPVESFVLPKKIKAKVDAQDPSKGSLVAVGFLDTGPDEVDLAGPATVDVGDLSFEVPGFTPNRSGTRFIYRSPGLYMVIAASRVGSSKAKFRLRAAGAVTDAPGLEEDITLRFANGVAEGFGIVDLDAGKFALGRKRGALVEPNLSLFRAKATLRGSGDDVLSLTLGLATNGTTPESVQDVHVGFGTFEATLPGGEFVRAGDRFTWKGSAGGVTLVALDYLKETILIKASGVDLGAFPEGGSAVPIRVGIGGDERIVTVRMGRKGPAFVY